jgi:hypothetical protein
MLLISIDLNQHAKKVTSSSDEKPKLETVNEILTWVKVAFLGEVGCTAHKDGRFSRGFFCP